MVQKNLDALFFYGMGFGDGGGRGGRGRGGGRGGGRGFAPDWICLACKQSNFAKVGPIPPTAPPPFIFWYPNADFGWPARRCAALSHIHIVD